MYLGTYYIVPFTTGCKFKIAEMPDGAADSIFSQGKLSAKAVIAIREIHGRYDVDLDQTLNTSELQTFFAEVSQKNMVGSFWNGCNLKFTCIYSSHPSTESSFLLLLLLPLLLLPLLSLLFLLLLL